MKLQEFAQVVRSKNSGPFEITFDILFKNREDYVYFVGQNILTEASFAELYQIKVEDIINFELFEAANGIKITIPRPWPQGTFGESDMHGSQQYANLMTLEIPD